MRRNSKGTVVDRVQKWQTGIGWGDLRFRSIACKDKGDIASELTRIVQKWYWASEV